MRGYGRNGRGRGHYRGSYRVVYERPQPVQRPQDRYCDEDDEPCRELRMMFDDRFKRWGSLPQILNTEIAACKDRFGDRFYPYTQQFTQKLFFNKHVLFIGDSLTRAIYKDLVGLLQNRNILQHTFLRKKSEHSHMHDRQVDFLPLDSDRVFKQAREFMTPNYLLQYVFTTRVMKSDVEKALLQLLRSREFPDLIVMNSALWDLTRYNPFDVDMTRIEPYDRNPEAQIENEIENMNEYIQRLSILLRRMKSILPPKTQVIWLCMPWPLPTGSNALTNRVDTQKQRKLHRSIYADGNFRAAQVVASAGYDVLDLGFYMRMHAIYPFRVHDGVHWDPAGTRLMTQLLIGHVAKNLGVKCQEYRRLTDRMRMDLHPAAVKFFKDINVNTPRGGERRGRSGSFTLPLQRKLVECTFQKMEPSVRKAFLDDIQTYRTSEILRRRRLELSDEDEERLQKMADDSPRVHKHFNITGNLKDRIQLASRLPEREPEPERERERDRDWERNRDRNRERNRDRNRDRERDRQRDRIRSPPRAMSRPSSVATSRPPQRAMSRPSSMAPPRPPQRAMSRPSSMAPPRPPQRAMSRPSYPTHPYY